MPPSLSFGNWITIGAVANWSVVFKIFTGSEVAANTYILPFEAISISVLLPPLISYFTLKEVTLSFETKIVPPPVPHPLLVVLPHTLSSGAISKSITA